MSKELMRLPRRPQVLNIIRQILLITQEYTDRKLVLDTIEKFSFVTYQSRAGEIQESCYKIINLIDTVNNVQQLCLQINWVSNDLMSKKTNRNK